MELAITANELRQVPAYQEKLLSWLRPEKNKSVTDWTIEQLGIRPYQHILEIGYGTGYTLKEVARKLKIGFLAGIDDSMTRYSQAYRRNKKLIHQQLLQLQIGAIHELPYPHHYFDTIYSENRQLLHPRAKTDLLQLANLLKRGGRMVMLFQPIGIPEKEITATAEKIKQDFLYAGLSNVEIAFRDMHPSTCMAVTGFRE